MTSNRDMTENIITLRKAMRMLDGEPWTIGTEDGEGWSFYFDGNELHNGSRGVRLEELLDRECVEVYARPERKYWSDEDRKYFSYMELEAGFAFIVKGMENGTI